MRSDDEILDWEDLDQADKDRVTDLLDELNELFNKYAERDDVECDDSTSDE